MQVFGYAMASVFVVSLVSLTGVFFLSINKDVLNKVLLFLVSFSAGTLLGDAFFHLIPDAFEANMTTAPILILAGLILFFVLEKFIHWRHCHETACDDHPHAFSYMILFGDMIHNFIDGLVIAASYLAGIEIGIATTIAVLLHEIPQEIGDFGSLVYGGFAKKKAIIFNFLSALTAIAGALFLFAIDKNFSGENLIPFAAGGFIYIAASDIIPELHKTMKVKDSILQLACLLLGIGIMYALLFIE